MKYLTLFYIVLSLFLLYGCIHTSTPEHVLVPAKESSAADPEHSPRTTLPSPDKNRAEASAPSLEPLPPDVSYYEAIKQLKDVFPSHLRPLIIDQQFSILLHDLNRDNQPEIFSLGIQTKDAPSDISLLSDYSRLLNKEEKALNFYLLCFRNKQGKFVRSRTIDLGQWHVYDSMRKMRLNKNRSNPIIVLVSFQTLEGRDHQLLIFNDTSGKPVYKTLLRETLSCQTYLEDIDGDGLLDMITQEKGMEEGIGYETFLTWKRWNGRSFVEKDSTNVVRNLNSFLQAFREQLIAGNITELINASMDHKLINRLKKQGYEESDILINILGLSDFDDSPLPKIREVIFPEILEYPFTVRDKPGSRFLLTFRIIDKNGISYLAETYLYMLRNPFGEKQFVLIPRNLEIYY